MSCHHVADAFRTGELLDGPCGATEDSIPIARYGNLVPDPYQFEESVLTNGFRAVGRHAKVGARPSGKAVALVVERRAEAAGFDPAVFSGLSLRAGLVHGSLGTGAANPAKAENFRPREPINNKVYSQTFTKGERTTTVT